MAALGLNRDTHRLWCGGESKDKSTDFGVAERARTNPPTLVWRGEQGQFHRLWCGGENHDNNGARSVMKR